MDEIILDLKEKMFNLTKEFCFPYRCLNNEFTIGDFDNESVNFDLPIAIDLQNVLHNRSWIELDLYKLGKSKLECLKDLFGEKYGNFIKFEDDARYVAKNWIEEATRVFALASTKKRETLLHVGCDSALEGLVFHGGYKKVILSDVSDHQLCLAKKSAPYASVFKNRSENLFNIKNGVVDMYVALRVFSSYGINYISALKEAYRVLKNNGEILISIPNGYRAKDDTILPGQIYGEKKASICGVKPFRDSFKCLKIMLQLGFSNLKVHMGQCEIYISGIKNKLLELNGVDVGSSDHIPVCFYSEWMPTSWLGNYFISPMKIDNIDYLSVEHYFQGAKFKDVEIVESIVDAEDPGSAKKIASKFYKHVRSDWALKRLNVMSRVVSEKFNQDKKLKELLLSTGNKKIIELSNRDMYWGEDLRGNGHNNMGRILMAVRDQFRS